MFLIFELTLNNQIFHLANDMTGRALEKTGATKNRNNTLKHCAEF